MNIAFRVDASQEIGLGHLMRCLTLANALRAEGAACMFLCSSNPINMLVMDAGHALYELPEDRLNEAADAEASQQLLDTPIDWLIVDHYGLGSAWETAMRGHAHWLAAIDDLANRRHDVDLLLDQNELDGRDHRYDDMLPKNSARLLGPRYALLRPEFSDVDCDREREGTLQRLLVNFGGTDPANATGLALRALEQLGWFDRRIDVVIGRLHPQAKAIAARCAAQPNWTFHVQTPHIAGLMKAADLALGAAGTSTWERCAVGLPSVMLSVADNQRPLAAAAAEAGAALWPGDAAHVDAKQLAALLATLDQCPQWLRSMSRAARMLCDGRGTRRVVRALLATNLTLRPATIADETLTLEWRNHPNVRRFSGDGQVIAPQRHYAWLTDVLADPQRALLIAEIMGKPIAVVRFDELTSDEPELSIYLAPERMGAGWGSDTLGAAAHWLRDGNHPAKAIRARIHPDNPASHSSFRKAGYQPQTQWWLLDLRPACGAVL